MVFLRPAAISASLAPAAFALRPLFDSRTTRRGTWEKLRLTLRSGAATPSCAIFWAGFNLAITRVGCASAPSILTHSVAEATRTLDNATRPTNNRIIRLSSNCGFSRRDRYSNGLSTWATRKKQAELSFNPPRWSSRVCTANASEQTYFRLAEKSFYGMDGEC
jgi:hypothetical protein